LLFAGLDAFTGRWSIYFSFYFVEARIQVRKDRLG
jgi:hypothetical protein